MSTEERNEKQEEKQVTGKVTFKRYRCTSCGHERQVSTNHYGQIYDRCENCSWKTPMNPQKVQECMEELPKGWARPENWKKVTIEFED